MADTTIPSLAALEEITGSALFVVDNGAQTFKITAQNVADSLSALTGRRTVERLRGNGTYTVAANVTAIRVRGIRPSEVQAITAMGNAYAWGNNFEGTLGDGTADNRSSPVAVIGGHIFEWKPLFSGMTLKPDGTAWGIGANSFGQLGDGTFLNKYSPVPVLGNRVFDKISNDNGYSATIMALDQVGRLWGWGLNGSGELGDGTTASRSSPVAVIGGHYFADFVMGSQVTYGLKADGSVWAWGGPSSFGNIGDGTSTARLSPVAVIGGHKFVKVCANTSAGNVYGLKADGTLWAWGANFGGLLGDGTTANRSSPVAVIGGHLFIDVAANGATAYGLKADGSVWAWGQDSAGSIGHGLSGAGAGRSSPVAVIGGHVFKRIHTHVQGNFPMAMKEDGSVWTWGDGGGFGGAGTGTLAPRSSPVAVVGGRTYAAVLPTAQQTFFLTREGKMYGCGLNGSGNLGDGTVADRSSPVAVIGNYTFGKQRPTRESIVNVKAGDSIPFSSLMGYFGPFYVGRDLEEIEIEYWVG